MASAIGQCDHQSLGVRVDVPSHPGHELLQITALQAVGVPAAKVMDMREVMLDPSLNRRGFYEAVDLGPGVGIRLLIGRPYIFRDSRADGAGPGIRLRAPHYGEHNHDVLAGPARYEPDEIKALYAAGVVGEAPTKQPIAKALDLEALIDKGSLRGVDPDFRERLEARGLPVPATLAPGPRDDPWDAAHD